MKTSEQLRQEMEAFLLDQQEKIKQLEAKEAARTKQLEEKEAAKQAKLQQTQDLFDKMNAQPIQFQSQDHQSLAQAALSLLETETKVIACENEIWRYNTQFGSFLKYPQEGINSFSALIGSFSGMLVMGAKQPVPIVIDEGDFRGTLKRAISLRLNEKFFNDEKLSCSFTNGYLKLENNDMKLVDHSPEYKCRFYHQFDYDSEAHPVKFINFLNSLFRDDEDKNEKIELLREYIGACLLGLATKHQRCIILYGESGDNGKSTLIKIIDKMFPEDFRSSLKPAEWSNRFSTSLLKNCRMNYVSELPDADSIKSDIFKQVISGDKLKAEEKGLRPFVFEPRCGHIFAANTLPEVSDINQAFWKRFIVISFNRKFEIHEQNPNIAKEIYSEIPCIINWCINGYKKVLISKKYTDVPSSNELLSTWKEDTNSVLSFIKNECVKTDGVSEFTILKDIYSAYNDYCKANNYKPFSLRKFAKIARTEFKLSMDDCKFGGESILPIILK